MLYLDNHYFYDAKMNLALEETLYTQEEIKEPILILWQNNDSVIIGKNQYTQKEINQDFINKNNIEVVRRITGGGAVFHDLGNLNFSIIFNKNSYSLKYFQDLIINSLNFSGLQLYSSGRNDILVNNYKISGASANIKKDRILYHGTILINSNLNSLSNSLTPPKEKLKSKNISSVKARVENLNKLSSISLSVNKVKDSIIKSFKESFDIKKIDVDKKLIKQVINLKKDRYIKNNWNFNYPILKQFKTKKFKCGIISLSYQLKHDKIFNLEIFGDFFSENSIKDLIQNLEGLNLTELKEKIAKINLNKYILGISKEEFIQLF